MTNETRRTYGILPSLFWESPEGRAVQARGKDPLIVSCYLRANRHATMLGLYRLRLDDVAFELPVLASADAIADAFVALQDADFAQYDAHAGVVWVRDMAWQRLNLTPGRPIDPEDGRRVVLQRLFDAVPPTPLVDLFFRVYGVPLRLARRTFAQPTLDVPRDVPPHDVPPAVLSSDDAPVLSREISTGGAGGGPGGRGRGEGAPAPGTSTRTADLLISTDQIDQVQISKLDRTAAAQTPLPLPPALVHSKPTTSRSDVVDDATRQPHGSNFQVIARAARGLLQDAELALKYLEGPIETQSDLVEATKRFCANYKIDYGRRDAVPFDVVHRACASEWVKFVAGVSRKPEGV